MKSNSKSIGNSYERSFSYVLSEWLTGEKDADVCWRDVGSGSRFTSRKKVGKETARKADIVCTNLKYQKFFDLFFIDTKSYKSFNPFFINQKNFKSNAILQQWIKTRNDCPKKMIPLMPCQIRDRITPEFIILPLSSVIYADNRMIIGLNKPIKLNFQIIILEDFLKNNIWEKLIASNLCPQEI